MYLDADVSSLKLLSTSIYFFFKKPFHCSFPFLKVKLLSFDHQLPNKCSWKIQFNLPFLKLNWTKYIWWLIKNVNVYFRMFFFYYTQMFFFLHDVWMWKWTQICTSGNFTITIARKYFYNCTRRHKNHICILFFRKTFLNSTTV